MHSPKLTNASAEGNCSQRRQGFVLVCFLGQGEQGMLPDMVTHLNTFAELSFAAESLECQHGFQVWVVQVSPEGQQQAPRAASSQKYVLGLCAHIWTFCANE